MKPRLLLLVTPIVAALALPAAADDHDHHDHDRDHHDRDRDHHDRDRDHHDHHDHGWDHRDHRDFHGHDFRFFSGVELSLWASGAWFHEWHDGRLGWWWVTDGVWYYYPAPAYPYPTYVPEPVVVVAPPPPPPAPVVVEPPPPAIQAAPPPQSWYYCEELQGYYPNVQTCPGPWHPVPAGQR